MNPNRQLPRKRPPTQSASGIDIDQLLQNLQLTPAERLGRMVEWSRWIKANQGVARPRARI